jgi:hypothetical protein
VGTKIHKLQSKLSGSKLTSEVLRTNKTLFLLIFAVVYGLIFINFIDIVTPGGNIGGYHLWLVLMYFVPFAILSVIDIKNWKLTLGLGLLTSVMNDVFYGLMRNMMGQPYDLTRYYNLWLIPQSTKLFTLNLGFITIPVMSWMMAASIYIRFGAVFALLEGHKYLLTKWNLSAYLSLRGQKVKAGGLKPIRQYEPEFLVATPEIIEIEEST